MGARNVAAVYTYWSAPLWDKARAFRVLTYMALTSRDDDDPPRFWGGRDALATIALGRRLNDGSQRHRAHVAVADAVADLEDSGALTVLSKGRTGRNAEYVLNLWKTAGTSQGEQVADVITLQAHPVAANRVSLTNCQGDPESCQGEPVPKEEEEDLGTLQEEQLRTSATFRAVDNVGSWSGY